MKTNVFISTFIMLLATYFSFAQTTLTFNLNKTDETISQNGYLSTFEVELKADQAGTYHTDLQVYLNYEKDIALNTVVLNDQVNVTSLTLLNGDYAGSEKYEIANIADNTDHRIAVITEPFASSAFSSNILTEVPTEFAPLIRIEILSQKSMSLDDVSFCEELMNGGQYYWSEGKEYPYSTPNHYTYGLSGPSPAGIEVFHTTEGIDIKVSPNPACNEATITISGDDDLSISVYDLCGQAIIKNLQVRENQSRLVIDVSSWDKGLYLIKASNMLFTQTIKLVKE